MVIIAHGARDVVAFNKADRSSQEIVDDTREALQPFPGRAYVPRLGTDGGMVLPVRGYAWKGGRWS